MTAWFSLLMHAIENESGERNKPDRKVLQAYVPAGLLGEILIILVLDGLK
jgi:hypothetical protein